MNRQKKRRRWAWALALALAVVNAQTAAAMSLNAPQSKPGQEAGERVYEVSLDVATVAAGENLSYLTVDPALADNPLAQDYYPGELTVELTGPVTVAAGGVLSIGKLAVSGPEPSPVLRGGLSPEGMIRVEAGGVLWLNGVTPELSGSGLAIVQEPGAIVEIFDTPLEELCQWGGAVVDNRYAAPVEVALAQGETLGEDCLPKEGRVWLNEKGKSKYHLLPMEWDTSSCGEQTGGTATVFGTYLDGDGQPIPALLPVEARLRWYTPEEIVLTEKSWMGNTAAAARLGYQALPEEAAEIWGELSRDEGKSWERWEECHFDESDGHLTCTFVLSDATPRQYRLAASDWKGSRIWRSEAVSLPEESDPDDSGGNRGGSTDPTPPSREPEPYDDETSDGDGDTNGGDPSPTPRPTPSPTPTPLPAPAPSPDLPPAATPVPTPELVAVSVETPGQPLEPPTLPEPSPSSAPEPPVSSASERSAAPEPSAASEPSLSPAPEGSADPEGKGEAALVLGEASPPPPATPAAAEGIVTTAETPALLSPSPAAEPLPTETAAPMEGERPEPALAPELQILLAAAGLGLCILVGLWAARGRAFRKRT